MLCGNIWSNELPNYCQKLILTWFLLCLSSVLAMGTYPTLIKKLDMLRMLACFYYKQKKIFAFNQIFKQYNIQKSSKLLQDIKYKYPNINYNIKLPWSHLRQHLYNMACAKMNSWKGIGPAIGRMKLLKKCLSFKHFFLCRKTFVIIYWEFYYFAIVV